VHGGGLITPPQSAALLSGITRDLVLELAQKGRIPCREEVISARDLIQAEEIWVTSSTREIVPVTCLDGKAVGTGRPGPLWREMDKWYQAYKAEVRAGRGGN
jgi:D-alanine transaminase